MHIATEETQQVPDLIHQNQSKSWQKNAMRPGERRRTREKGCHGTRLVACVTGAATPEHSVTSRVLSLVSRFPTDRHRPR